MKRLLILGAVWALAVARPELYKEKEDFQFSRSSSDDGTKSGFYGAQRGNMGGNYERAHNMDSLAQNQMSGLVRHVEGELGDGARTRTGSVYTAANSAGTYGSAHYDLSNLAGRNFKEGVSHDDSQSQSSLSSAAYNSAQYANSRLSSRQSGYQTAAHSGLNMQTDDLQSLDHTQGASLYDYGRQSSQSAGYHSQSGLQQHSSAYDNSQTNANSGYGSNVRTRYVSATPVRIIVRPGTRVAIPLAASVAPSYDVIHGSALIDQNSLNSEAEVLSNDNQRAAYVPTGNNPKHYESSYNYRKEWEKHDTIPSAIPLSTSTVNPFQHSELYEDTRARATNNQYDASRVDSQRAQASSLYGGYIANVKTSRSNYDAQNQRAATLSNANAYTQTGYSAASAHRGTSVDSALGYSQTQNTGSLYHGAAADANSLTQAGYKAGYNADLNSQVEDLNAKPKSYQSSYSYHKSWERQGDPYVIRPASSAYYDAQSAQRLTGATKTGFAATGSHYQHSHQSEADCDENGHIRVARSYKTDQEAQQQSQNIEEFGQQTEDLGQQTQTTWDQQDAVQQSQSTWGNLEDLGQQSQNKWDRLEDLGQQTQNKWDKLEDLGQQTQQTWDKFEDFGQQTQQARDHLENLGQQIQNDLGQKIQDTEIELGHKLHTFNQQTQDKWDLTNTGQQDQVHEQNQDEQQNQFTQQEAQPELNNTDSFTFLQTSEKENKNENSHQTWNKFDHFGSHQSRYENKSKEENFSSSQFNRHTFFQNGSTNQQAHDLWNNFDVTSQLESHNSAKPLWEQSINNFQQTHNTGENIEQSNTGAVSLNSGYFNSQSHINQNQFQTDENNWNLLYSSSHRQDQTTNTNSYSNKPLITSQTFETNPSGTSPLLSLWNKLDNIEQQSTSLTNLNNGNVKPHYVYQPIQPEVGKELMSTKKEDIESVSSDEKERPQDIGRGDIGPEDLSDSAVDNKPSRISFEKAVEKEDTHKSVDSGKYFGQQENVDQQQLENLNQQNLQNNGKQNLQEHQKHEQQSLEDFGHRELLEQQNKQNVESTQSQEQREKLAQENLQVIGLQKNLVPNNTQHFRKLDIEQQNLQVPQENFEQQNQQDFAQHENWSQQNLQNYGQQENLEQIHLDDFAQQENVEQKNEQEFEQHQKQEMHNLQDFGQQENVEQTQDKQNLEHHDVPDFGQQSILDFGQQSGQDYGQQSVQDFGQQSVQDFGQQSVQDFGQQSIQDFGQQSVQDFGHQSIQDFGQQNIQEFGQLEENFRHQDQEVNEKSDQHIENLNHQNIHKLGQLNKDPEQIFNKEQAITDPKISLQQTNLPHPAVVVEPIQVQKQNNGLQSISLHSSSAKNEEVPPIEPVTEKPGFWKSVGSKLSRAKSKVASWFSS